jgi:PKD repeat protein/Flp pilus assembly protein TadG
MRLPSSRIFALNRAHRTRGQSLVEFALTLPVLLMLTLIALDFGRVYLGYINVQNMARIAANFAANNPDAWSATPDATRQTQYRNQILADASATNCRLPKAGGVPVLPDPTFSDANGDGTTTDLGDRARVQLTCTFDVITPVISSILGGSVRVSAESSFPVKTGMTAFSGGSGSGGSGIPPNAAFIANSAIVTPDPLTIIGPDVAVDFRDTSGGGSATDWAWDFDDGGTSTAQDVTHAFTCATPPCTYAVAMTATNPFGSSSASMEVTVVDASDVNFVSDVQVIDRGGTVTFTDASTSGGTSYDWTFGDGGIGSGTSAAHTYLTAGTFDVSLTVTYPAPTGDVTTTKIGYITVNDGYCPVPSLIGVKFNDANGIWQGPPNTFTGTVQRDATAPNGNFKIGAQSITGGPGQTALCSSNILVGQP